MNSNTEQWVDIDGYIGHYQVSNRGFVRSFKHGGLKSGKILASRIGKNGYGAVSLSLNGVVLKVNIHRLVATAFIPNPDNKKEVNHIDGNKLNCDLVNLEWATKSENGLHSWKTGLNHSVNIGMTGVKNYNSKKVYQYDMRGNLIKLHDAVSDAFRELRIRNISMCAHGKRSHAGGFIWKYV